MTTRAIAVQALSKIFAAVAGASHKPKEVLETLSGQLDDRDGPVLEQSLQHAVHGSQADARQRLLRFGKHL